MSRCPFCEEEIYCTSEVSCMCGKDHSNWPLYEEFKCPHCGKFNMCIDRRFDKMKKRLHNIQAYAAEENVEANQNAQWILWLDQPTNQAICDSKTKRAIKEGHLIVRQIQEVEESL
nr:hypothetical protein [Chlamydiales bacterium]